jgi:transposase
MSILMPTPIQIRDKIIKDLKAQVANLKELIRQNAEASIVPMLQSEIAWLNAAYESQRDELMKKDAMIEKLKDIIGVYEVRLNKDSSNSSKPPSTDGFAKPSPRSSRKPSGKKPGGQNGHEGHTMNADGANTTIIERREGCCDCGGDIKFNDTFRARKLIDIEIIVHTTEERVFDGICEICGKQFTAQHSDDFRAPLQYGDNLRAFTVMLNEYGNVPDDKTAEILRDISNGRISVSAGTVVNFRDYAANAMADEADKIRNNIKNADVLCVDETGTNVNGKLCWTAIYVAKDNILFELNKKRGEHCNSETGLIVNSTNILVHDHFKAYYRGVAATHAECNVHPLRDLRAVIEIHKHVWAQDMVDFLVNAKDYRLSLINSDITSLPDGEYDKYEKDYIAILNQGDLEYTAATEHLTNKRMFNAERCLLKRLRDFKDEHLRFMADFRVPFGNNDAERGAHKIKNKIRVSGGFRSMKGAKNHMKIASVIMTARVRGENVLKTIKNALSKRTQPSHAPTLTTRT